LALRKSVSRKSCLPICSLSNLIAENDPPRRAWNSYSHALYQDNERPLRNSGQCCKARCPECPLGAD
jgi:hypothetical protein